MGISDPYPELKPKRNDLSGEWARSDQRPRGAALPSRRMSVRQTAAEVSVTTRTAEGAAEGRYRFGEGARLRGALRTLGAGEEAGSQTWSLSDDANELTVIGRRRRGGWGIPTGGPDSDGGHGSRRTRQID